MSVTHPMPQRRYRRSPTTALLFGLLLILATVTAYSWYLSRQIAGLRQLQTDLTDRNRRDSLQLLRIQDDLNQLGLAMRDMLDGDQRYPLAAWSAQFDRHRLALEDAISRQADVSVARRTPEQSQYLASAFAQFWDAVERMFEQARAGRDEEARTHIRVTLQARQSALSSAVARLLVQNNEAEAETARLVQAIYDDVERQVYWLLAATLGAIAGTSVYLIRSNRRLFAELGALSEARRDIAQRLMATREATLREIARELHDDLGQLLTAMGSMLRRTSRKVPDDSPIRSDLREIGEIAQAMLENVRGLSQTLHPSTLEELGLESTIDWYLSTVQKSLGLQVSYERPDAPLAVDATTGIHVYRILQEALTNVARHGGTAHAHVRLRFEDGALQLDVEDHGKGFGGNGQPRGLGLVTMGERAELLGGTLDFDTPPGGGTVVRLRVPVRPGAAAEGDVLTL
jgi:signal transduction histidine kinase